jgi:hypothetical protein
VRLDALNLAWEAENLKAALALMYMSEGSRGIDYPYGTLSDGASTWFALQEPIRRSAILGFSIRMALSAAIECWAKGEYWFGDTAKLSLMAGAAYRYSTK